MLVNCLLGSVLLIEIFSVSAVELDAINYKLNVYYHIQEFDINHFHFICLNVSYRMKKSRTQDPRK